MKEVACVSTRGNATVTVTCTSDLVTEVQNPAVEPSVCASTALRSPMLTREQSEIRLKHAAGVAPASRLLARLPADGKSRECHRAPLHPGQCCVENHMDTSMTGPERS